MSLKPDYAIDLEKVVAAKGGHLPSFVIKALGKFLHLDFLNKFFVLGYEGVEFCEETLKYLDVQIDVEGLERIPDDGTLYTFASNHPLGGIDGVALGGIVGRKFDGRIKYLVNDFLMSIKGLAPVCVPINKVGAQSRNLPSLINEAFHSDNHILIFPAGLCSRKTGGKIQDLEWGKAFITKSVESGRAVVPVHFIAENSKRFYRIAKLCTLLKAKFNFAMLLLPDEMVRAQHSRFKVIFGEPVPSTAFDRSRTPLQWAAWMREQVYKLQ